MQKMELVGAVRPGLRWPHGKRTIMVTMQSAGERLGGDATAFGQREDLGAARVEERGDATDRRGVGVVQVQGQVLVFLSQVQLVHGYEEGDGEA